MDFNSDKVFLVRRGFAAMARPRFFLKNSKRMAKKEKADECTVYRSALKAIKNKIDLYGGVINPSAEEMRFIYTELQRIVDNALSYGESANN